MSKSKSKKYRITHHQGQILLQQASRFIMPDKMEAETITIAERAIAGHEVRELYRELKVRSPYFVKDPATIRFGPKDNWERKDAEDSLGKRQEGWHLINPYRELDVCLDRDSHMGVFRILFVLLHPGSTSRAPVGMVEDHLWPMAERLRLVKMLKDALPKGTKRELELDEDEEVPEEPGNGSNEEEPALSESK